MDGSQVKSSLATESGKTVINEGGENRPLDVKAVQTLKMLESKYPKIVVAQRIKLLQSSTCKDREKLISKMMDKITARSLAYLYKYVTLDQGLAEFDQAKFENMLGEAEINLKWYDCRISQAEEQHKDDEIASIMFERSNFLSYIGDKEGSLNYLKELSQRKNTISAQLRILFHNMRIGFFFNDRKLVSDNLNTASEVIKKSTDWDLKNEFFAYSGLYYMWNRNFDEACVSFFKCTSSFNMFSIMDLSTFCSYAAICGLLSFPRKKLYSKIINGPDLQEGLFHAESIKALTDSYYNCDYCLFTKSLKMMVNEMKYDLFLNEHIGYLCRELRLMAYRQILISFKSLTLRYLCEVFSLKPEFIEYDIAQFIAMGRLDCKIDLVNGMVVTANSDKRNAEFAEFIEKSDRLLNTVRYLERTVNE